MKGTSGKLLSEVYLSAWRLGLKTTYYLRTLAASQIEKSTLDASRFGYTQKREYGVMAAEEVASASEAQGLPEGFGQTPMVTAGGHPHHGRRTGQHGARCRSGPGGRADACRAGDRGAYHRDRRRPIVPDR